MGRATQQDVRETEYMSLTHGVGIIPEKFRNRAYDKLDFGPGEGGLRLADGTDPRGDRNRGSVDEDKLGAAIGAALGVALEPVIKGQSELAERLESIEAAATEPDGGAKPKTGNGKQS